MDGDFLLALRLQAEWEAEDGEAQGAKAVAAAASPAASPGSPARPLSVVDSAWELLDPSPDVRGLFLQFNETLFWGRLAAVEVKWSPRMTLCAGVCCYEGRGGMCSIRLSEPLLKLRPRKDLVETLLHEMIHALLFVTNNDKDHESHGPEFCKHMHRINRLTGANITIYHEFHDEVDSYRQHWWRCNGPCQNKKPYFGYVKRAMNRAPSANDFWWAEHQQTCGGTYTKVKEPENYTKKGKEKVPQSKFLADGKGNANRDNMQNLIPFSGKGYILGGKSTLSPSERTTSPSNDKNRLLLSSQHHSPSGLIRSNPQNASISSPFPSEGDKNSFASYVTLPKISVANKKAYTNVNGSPIKHVSFNGGRSKSSPINVTWDLPSKTTPVKSISGPSTSTPKPHSSSHRNSSTPSGGPTKRAKMEDTAAFEKYFIQKTDPELTSPSLKRKHEPIASERPATSASDENRNVSCPVCSSEVLEAKINEHLDSCLQDTLT
ncbi:sprT-like domain-containing protein Spartan [Podarcis lilfordi]|uniref:DNA-dependent metalloprotease SPRTN n=2 Tax=Podarcis lilfordi TaxID=74358 RepID=A0AA35P0H0_9SAUR|nr:sprT-like domain-containing protein Spartan [Podarcis lilfordi]